MIDDVLFFTTVSFFAIYGVIQLVFFILDFIFDYRKLKNKKIYTVIAVRNEEDRVEGFARALTWKALRQDTGVSDCEIVFVDFGSADKTVHILKSIQRDEGLVRVISKEDFLNELEDKIKNTGLKYR